MPLLVSLTSPTRHYILPLIGRKLDGKSGSHRHRNTISSSAHPHHRLGDLLPDKWRLPSDSQPLRKFQPKQRALTYVFVVRKNHDDVNCGPCSKETRLYCLWTRQDSCWPSCAEELGHRAAALPSSESPSPTDASRWSGLSQSVRRGGTFVSTSNSLQITPTFAENQSRNLSNMSAAGFPDLSRSCGIKY